MTALQLRKQTCQPVERLCLETCLRILGLKLDRKGNGKYGYRIRVSDECTEGRLWDLYELAKAAYLSRCKKLRTDLTENHEVAVFLTTLWRHTKELFRRRGIESN